MQIKNKISDFFDMSFNPCSNNFNSQKHFYSKLSHHERIKVVVTTILASFLTLGIGGMGTFRYSVSVYAAEKKKSVPATIPLNEFIHSIFSGSSPNYSQIENYSNAEVKTLLTDLFGKRATNSVFCWYKLLEKKHISSIAVHALILGIAANLTVHDLDIIEKNRDPFFIKMNTNICPETEDPTKRKVELLKKMREISLLPRTSLVLQEIRRRGFQNQLAKDSEFITSCRWVDNIEIDPNIKTYDLNKFSYSEYLSRVIIYGLEAKGNFAAFQPGTLVPVPLINEVSGIKQTVLMETHRLISKGGLHAVVLIPSKVNPLNKDQTLPVQILFRGTKSASAWNRNLNLLEKQQMYGWEGPGGASFNRSRVAILEELQNILTLLPRNQPIKFEIFGHSLGASDAQRMCALLTELLASEQPILPKENKVKEVNLFCYNAPGVEDNLNQNFVEMVEGLNEIQFNLRYFKVAHDIIQTAANQLLGYCIRNEEPIKNLFVSVFKIALPLGSYLAAHVTTFLCNLTDLTKKIQNEAWIESVKTNNPEDAEIRQYGPKGNEQPSPCKYKPSGAYKALDNRGIWTKTVRSLVGISKRTSRTPEIMDSQTSQETTWDKLSASYLSLSEKLYGSKDLSNSSLIESPENMQILPAESSS